jgi:HEAT repeat protein
MDRFLDRLRDSQVGDERVRILQLLTEVGRPAVPSIRGRIDRNEPWYFLRNLAYLLGRIESAAAAEALTPFLLHQNDKVRQEALKSIHRLGSRDGGPILLSILNQVDETFQVSVVEELGSLKYGPAAAPLIALLKDRSLIVSAQRAELEEKICLALGRMNAVEAAPILKEISNAGFFSMKKYSDKVKAAAAKALMGLKPPKR